jgi:hypothetical protein
MHRKTRKGEIMPKTREKSLTRSQKRDFWWGMVKIRRPGAFIEPVGSSSGRLINPVRPLEPRTYGRTRVPFGRMSYTRPDVDVAQIINPRGGVNRVDGKLLF